MYSLVSRFSEKGRVFFTQGRAEQQYMSQIIHLTIKENYCRDAPEKEGAFINEIMSKLN